VERPTEEVENEYGGFFVHSGELKTKKKKRVSDFQEADSPEKNKPKRCAFSSSSLISSSLIKLF
jgi:hypothetical protein